MIVFMDVLECVGRHSQLLHIAVRSKKVTVAVYRLFKNQAFEPEAISAMSQTYTEVCGLLGVTDRDQRGTHAVAKTVIEFAQRGARDPVRLRDCVLRALRNEPDGPSRQPARPAAQGFAERQSGL